MLPNPNRSSLLHITPWARLAACAAVLLVGCTVESPAPPKPVDTSDTSTPKPTPPISAATVDVISGARTARDYRRDAAAHLYAKNSHRIFNGKLPPMLYAIGVLQVDINARGSVTALRWMRAPSHVPEVVAEIERTVRQAAPFPVPLKMGRVTYTDTWLWDKSGKFQLDTLTEGQL